MTMLPAACLAVMSITLAGCGNTVAFPDLSKINPMNDTTLTDAQRRKTIEDVAGQQSSATAKPAPAEPAPGTGTPAPAAAKTR